ISSGSLYLNNFVMLLIGKALQAASGINLKITDPCEYGQRKRGENPPYDKYPGFNIPLPFTLLSDPSGLPKIC
ncbi:MAG: hypothetical protein WCI43_07985, partial [Candidatus Firestonebacteria bacterium]